MDDDDEGAVAVRYIATSTNRDTVLQLAWDDIVAGNAVVECNTNAQVDSWNREILMRAPGTSSAFFAHYRYDPDTKRTGLESLLSDEFVSHIEASGVPPHVLELKEGCICTVERNLLLEEKLAHNTKVRFLRRRRHFLEVSLLSLKKIFLLPRIHFKLAIPDHTLERPELKTFQRKTIPLNNDIPAS